MAVHSTVGPSRAWILAARPKTLPAALSPVIVGSAVAIADGVFALGPAIAAALGALLLQVGSNFANDYFDHARGADTPDRIGPTRVTASGLLSEQDMRRGIIAVFAASVCVGLYLVYIGGWPVVLVGIASIASALAYTGGPFPFGYYGLGDLFVFIFFGLVAVCGTYYVQALEMNAMVVASAIPVGALITAILVVNNFRDIDTDRRAGKYTLAVYLGQTGTRAEYGALVAVAYLIPLVFWLVNMEGAWVLLPWLSLPLAATLLKSVFSTTSGPVLNQTLAGTARLSLLFSILFAAGLILG